MPKTCTINILKYNLRPFLFLFWEWKLLNSSVGKTISSLLETDFHFSNQKKGIEISLSLIDVIMNYKQYKEKSCFSQTAWSVEDCFIFFKAVLFYQLDKLSLSNCWLQPPTLTRISFIILIDSWNRKGCISHTNLWLSLLLPILYNVTNGNK